MAVSRNKTSIITNTSNALSNECNKYINEAMETMTACSTLLDECTEKMDEIIGNLINKINNERANGTLTMEGLAQIIDSSSREIESVANQTKEKLKSHARSVWLGKPMPFEVSEYIAKSIDEITRIENEKAIKINELWVPEISQLPGYTTATYSFDPPTLATPANPNVNALFHHHPNMNNNANENAKDAPLNHLVNRRELVRITFPKCDESSAVQTNIGFCIRIDNESGKELAKIMGHASNLKNQLSNLIGVYACRRDETSNEYKIYMVKDKIDAYNNFIELQNQKNNPNPISLLK